MKTKLSSLTHLNLLAHKTFTTTMFLVLLGFSLHAQNSWRILGNVLDENEPLAFATVYATPAAEGASNTILEFATTDELGYFALEIDTSHRQIILIVNYLGYETYRIDLNSNSVFPLSVQLVSSANELSEVIVTDKITPIVERGDTIKYDADQFADVSVKKVEDLLRNLPGVEVDEEGLIKVDGKPIKKVLIEDTDMFDSQYTIGTKNLSAEIIESVEIIDHYQENEVLKNIESSEDIVLNLRLKEDVKNKLAGNITEGIGYGDELKASLEANIFTVNKKQKILFIGNNGNTGEQYSLSNIRASSSFGSKSAFTTDIENTPIFTNEVLPNYLGIDGRYINNSINVFNTLRSFFDIDNNTKLKVNVTYSSQKDEQTTDNLVSSLFQPDLYENDTQEKIQFKNALSNVDLTYNYLHPFKNQKFDIFISYQNNTHDGDQEFKNNINNDVLFSNVGLRSDKLLISSLYSLTLSESSALLIAGKMNVVNGLESFIGNNIDFNDILTATSEMTEFRQNIDFSNKLSELSTKYFTRFWGLAISAETRIKTTRLKFSPIWFSRNNNSPQEEQLDFLSSSSQRDLTWTNNVNIKKQFNEKTSLTINNSFYNRTFQQGDEVERFDLWDTYGLNLFLSNEINATTTLSMFYQYSNNPVNNFDLLSTRYVQGIYNFVENIPKNRLTGGHLLGLKFSNKNIRELSSYYLTLQVKLKERNWVQDFDFVNSVVISRPFFADNNNQISINGFWDKFVPLVKTNFEIRPVVSFRQSSVVNNDVVSSTQAIRLGSDFSASLRLNSELFLRFDGSVHKSYFKSDGSATNDILSIKALPYVLWEKSDWSFKLLASYQNNFSSSSSFDILNTRFEIARPIKIGTYETDITLKIFNLLNQNKFSSVSNSEFFIFESNVKAIRPFFVLKIAQNI